MNVTTTLVAVNCYSCGVDYAIPAILDRVAQEKRGLGGHHVWCPNGHAWYYIGETDAEKYKRLYAESRDHTAAVRAERDQAEASLRATKGVVTKMRKRAIAGACQFCHRHFVNVERHVATKHPGEQL